MIVNGEIGPTFAFPDKFGFCGGVAAAVDIADNAARTGVEAGVPVFGFHDVVHNDVVIDGLESAGITFIDDIDSVPADSAVVISAHGASPEIFYQIRQNGSDTIDATCPLVTHAHKGIQQARAKDEKVIYVCKGKPGEVDNLHDEVLGAVGHMDFWLTQDGELVREPVERSFLELTDDPSDSADLLSDGERYRIVTQTTLHADHCLDFREKVKRAILDQQPNATVNWARNGDVCRAVADRQKGVEQLVSIRPNHIVVVTDKASKNGMGYKKQAEDLVMEKGLDTSVTAVANGEEAADILALSGVIAVTASASTPKESIEEVVEVLGGDSVPPVIDREFTLPDANRIPEIIDRLRQQKVDNPV